MKQIRTGKSNTFIVMHYCYNFQHRSKVPVLLWQPVYTSSFFFFLGKTEWVCSGEALQCFQIFISCQKSEIRDISHCGLPDFLFVFFLVLPSLYDGKPFKHAAESVLITQQCTSGSSKRDAIYLFRKQKWAKLHLSQHGVPTQPTTASAFPPAAQKQMNWQVNCALRKNYSSWVSGSLSYRVHARGTMNPSWRQ